MAGWFAYYVSSVVKNPFVHWIPGSRRAMKGAVLLVAAAVVFAQPAAPASALRPVTEQAKARVLTKVQTILTKYAFVPGVDFDTFPDMLKSERERLEVAKTDVEFASAVNSALRKYGLSHISLFTPSFGEQRRTQKKAGLGIRVEPTPKGLVITSLVGGAAAEQAGLLPGDLIVSCDGKPVTGVEGLAGDDGQKSTLVVSRIAGGVAKQLKIEVTRRVFSTAIPESLTMKNQTAVVTIPSFDNGYDRDNVDRIMTEAVKAKSLVLDLRGNGGGRVTNLLHLAGYLIPKEQAMGVWVSRETAKRYEKEHGPTKDVVAISQLSSQEVEPFPAAVEPFLGPVAVLINGGTGSASEMMAAALQELKGAQVIGQKSAGAVLASIMREVEGGDGFWIQYPLLDYVTSKGIRLEGRGVTPAVVRPTPRFGEPDLGMEAALAWVGTATR